MTAPSEPARLRILNYNTHIGRTLPEAVRSLLEDHSPHLVVLQEVQSPHARFKARRLFLPTTWSAVGTSPRSRGPGWAGTLIFARRSALKLVGSSNEMVTPFRDKMHPQRRCTLGRYVHRATGQVLDVGSVHLWHLHGASDEVREAHRQQLRAHVDSARRARDAGRLAFRIGDFNEPIDGRGDTAAEIQLAQVGLRPARPASDHARRLDEIFAPDGLACRDFRAISLPEHFPGVQGEHKALVVEVTIPRRSQQHHSPAAGQRAGAHS